MTLSSADPLLPALEMLIDGSPVLHDCIAVIPDGDTNYGHIRSKSAYARNDSFMYPSRSHGGTILVKGRVAIRLGRDWNSTRIATVGRAGVGWRRPYRRGCWDCRNRGMSRHHGATLGFLDSVCCSPIARDSRLRFAYRDACSGRRRTRCFASCYYAQQRLPHARLHRRMRPCANQVRFPEPS